VDDGQGNFSCDLTYRAPAGTLRHRSRGRGRCGAGYCRGSIFVRHVAWAARPEKVERIAGPAARQSRQRGRRGYYHGGQELRTAVQRQLWLLRTATDQPTSLSVIRKRFSANFNFSIAGALLPLMACLFLTKTDGEGN